MMKNRNRLVHVLCSLLVILITGGTVSASEEIIYYHNDALGSPVAATDQSGAVIWQEAYKPFGERIKREDGGENAIGFTGKPHDDSIGLSYFGARWYDPVVGRFMGIDPVGFQETSVYSFNRYAYANNNPYRYVDPDGNIPVDTVWDGFNVIYDCGKIVVGWVSGDSELVDQGKEDVGWDTAAFFVPYMPAGTTRLWRSVPKGGPLWSTTKSKSAVENAFGHWSKHKSEFPELQNAKQYAERAKDFLTNPSKGTLTKTNSRGDTLRYDPSTNTFGVLGKDGAPRTMFRPKDGMDYWNRQ